MYRSPIALVANYYELIRNQYGINRNYYYNYYELLRIIWKQNKYQAIHGYQCGQVA